MNPSSTCRDVLLQIMRRPSDKFLIKEYLTDSSQAFVNKASALNIRCKKTRNASSNFHFHSFLHCLRNNFSAKEVKAVVSNEAVH
jgi:hypothetical protein